MSPDAPKIRSDEKVALVLGAGGARGLAQIGVIEALEARGMNIVAIAGSSSGALVGGLHACGKLHDLYVEPEARGLGAGRALCEAMLKRMSELGAPRVVLSTQAIAPDIEP